MYQEVIVAIRQGLSDIASSDDWEDGEDENDDETELGKLCKDDEPSWVMGTMSKTEQPRIERFRQKLMKLHKLTQPGWGEAADYFHGRDNQYGTSELNVPAVVKLQMDQDVAIPASTTFAELMEYLVIVPRILQMP